MAAWPLDTPQPVLTLTPEERLQRARAAVLYVYKRLPRWARPNKPPGLVFDAPSVPVTLPDGSTTTGSAAQANQYADRISIGTDMTDRLAGIYGPEVQKLAQQMSIHEILHTTQRTNLTIPRREAEVELLSRKLAKQILGWQVPPDIAARQGYQQWVQQFRASHGAHNLRQKDFPRQTLSQLRTPRLRQIARGAETERRQAAREILRDRERGGGAAMNSGIRKMSTEALQKASQGRNPNVRSAAQQELGHRQKGKKIRHAELEVRIAELVEARDQAETGSQWASLRAQELVLRRTQSSV